MRTNNGSVLIGMIAQNIVMRFSYDAGGNVAAVDYSTDGGSTFTTYYYVRNAQNDIVKLIDNSGNSVVEYTYDSWGKVISSTSSLSNGLKNNQPFRYRGYVYDTETQWYYLQSRYYDPNTCRFISADVLLSTGQGVIGHNAFAYCGNNPVVRIDSKGTFFFTVIGAVVGAATGAISAAIHGEDIVAGAIGGAVSGAITGCATDITVATGGLAGPVAAIAVGAVSSAAGELTTQFVGNLRQGQSASEALENVDYVDVGTSFVFGGVFGYLSYGAANACKDSILNSAIELYEESLESGIIGNEASMLVKSATCESLCEMATDIVYYVGSTVCCNLIKTGRKFIRRRRRKISRLPIICKSRYNSYESICR